MVLNLLTKICKIYTLHCAHNMRKVFIFLFFYCLHMLVKGENMYGGGELIVSSCDTPLCDVKKNYACKCNFCF